MGKKGVGNVVIYNTRHHAGEDKLQTEKDQFSTLGNDPLGNIPIRTNSTSVTLSASLA